MLNLLFSLTIHVNVNYIDMHCILNNVTEPNEFAFMSLSCATVFCYGVGRFASGRAVLLPR